MMVIKIFILSGGNIAYGRKMTKLFDLTVNEVALTFGDRALKDLPEKAFDEINTVLKGATAAKDVAFQTVGQVASFTKIIQQQNDPDSIRLGLDLEKSLNAIATE